MLFFIDCYRVTRLNKIRNEVIIEIIEINPIQFRFVTYSNYHVNGFISSN